MSTSNGSRVGARGTNQVAYDPCLNVHAMTAGMHGLKAMWASAVRSGTRRSRPRRSSRGWKRLRSDRDGRAEAERVAAFHNRVGVGDRDASYLICLVRDAQHRGARQVSGSTGPQNCPSTEPSVDSTSAGKRP